jgi:isocitrate dehydrogenase
LNAVQGQTTILGGYYRPNTEIANTIMRPSATLNRLLAEA